MKLESAGAFFTGQVSLQHGDGWIQPWRLPFADIELFPSPGDGLLNNATHCAGIRLRFATDAAEVKLLVDPIAEAGDRLFDLTIAGELLQTVALPAAAGEVVFGSLPAGEKTVEIWLPCNASVRVCGIAVESGSSLLAVPDWRRRWTTYGSSITKCGAAHSPARTWPAVAARKHNLNLTCLGFGGQCHIEPLLATLIRDLPADFISLKLGINVNGGGSLSPRTFKPAVLGMVRIIREKHPRTPLALISPIISPPREDKKSNGLSLEDMRVEVADAARRLRTAGDLCLDYFDGRMLMGAEDLTMLPDNLHPDGDGYELMGNRFADKIISKFNLR